MRPGVLAGAKITAACRRTMRPGAIRLSPPLDERDLGPIRRGVRDEIVNVASGTAVPVTAIVDRLEHRLGVPARREWEAGGAAHLVSTDKLRLLVPEVADMGFGTDYPMTVIDSYAAATRTEG